MVIELDALGIVALAITLVLLLNILLALVTMFRERREPSSLWAWILVMFFIPVLGFLLWIFVGRRLTKKRIFRRLQGSSKEHGELAREQLREIASGTFAFANPASERHRDVVELLMSDHGAQLTEDNAVTVFNDGVQKFDALLADIATATDHVHIYYYIFRADGLGTRILDALTERARAGVQVRLFYDALGGRQIYRRDLQPLRAAGGQVYSFFPSKIPFINLRVNNRTHRKLAVIDGRVGYVGGFNVGDEYLGLSPKFGYWRDTHLRVEGGAVDSIQRRLLTDWNAVAPAEHRVRWEERFFPADRGPAHGVPRPAGPAEHQTDKPVGLQIASSGPDSDWERIKFGYIKMINSAERSVWIQTPYFMPDAAVLDALKIAARSGLDVRMMIPDKPDHLLVYPATLSYADELAQAGATIYIYRNGFVHAKTVLVDHELGSVGTANMDIRSFRLNFEVCAFFYDADLGTELRDIYLADISKSTVFDRNVDFGRNWSWPWREGVSRLVSPLL